jgi:hypothetical protein
MSAVAPSPRARDPHAVPRASRHFDPSEEIISNPERQF